MKGGQSNMKQGKESLAMLPDYSPALWLTVEVQESGVRQSAADLQEASSSITGSTLVKCSHAAQEISWRAVFEHTKIGSFLTFRIDK